MATTGANTSAQWTTAANNATNAAHDADLKAFDAEQAVLDAKAGVFRANTALEAAQASGDPARIAAAQQQVQTATDAVTQQQVIATEYRTQANNAVAAAVAAEDLAAKNSGLTPSTTPPASVTPAESATNYTPSPPIQSVTSPSPSQDATQYQANTTIVTNTVTTTTTVTNTTGGSSTTIYNSQPLATPASENLTAQANAASKEAALYSLNPDTPFGSKALDNKLATGQITQEQYNAIKNSTPEERATLKAEAQSRANVLYDQANAAKVDVPPEVVRTNEPNTTAVTTNSVETKTVETAKVTGTIEGNNVTVDTIDGQTYQVTQNTAENTTTYTDTNNAANSITVETTSVENVSPSPISSLNDPALQQQANQGIIESIRYESPAQVSPFNDPAQQQQAIQESIANETPVIPSTLEDPAQRGAALQEAIENPGPLSPSDVVDPAQRQQNEIIQSEFPVTPSTFEDPAQRGQQQLDLIENSVPAAIPTSSDPAQQAAANIAASNAVPVSSLRVTPAPAASARGLLGAIQRARASATAQDQSVLDTTKDWRVKLSLGPNADYLYNASDPGILAPLKVTEGVIFPYTPQISVTYTSTYDPSEITHSNYKIFQYKSSGVDSISVTCDFTAQDTYEANYILAVIHFFRSVTKMFYGQDQSPKGGVPPPLCFLTGLGQYQFNGHPLVISNFTYNLPTDVDYIRADVDISTLANSITELSPANLARLTGGIQPGGDAEPPRWVSPKNNKASPSYVPTKMQLSFQAHPIVTRNDISNNFSLKQYATGGLLRRGIW